MLESLDIPYVDAFELWAEKGYGMSLFLPEPVDAHLNANGYRAVAQRVGDALLAQPEIRLRLSGR